MKILKLFKVFVLTAVASPGLQHALPVVTLELVRLATSRAAALLVRSVCTVGNAIADLRLEDAVAALTGGMSGRATFGDDNFGSCVCEEVLSIKSRQLESSATFTETFPFKVCSESFNK